jgi:hypothetical protein
LAPRHEIVPTTLTIDFLANLADPITVPKWEASGDRRTDPPCRTASEQHMTQPKFLNGIDATNYLLRYLIDPIAAVRRAYAEFGPLAVLRSPSGSSGSRKPLWHWRSALNSIVRF